MARIEASYEPTNGAAFARGIPALEDHDDAAALLAQLAAQTVETALQRFELLVVGVLVECLCQIELVEHGHDIGAWW